MELFRMSESDIRACKQAQESKNTIELRNLLYHGHPMVRALACRNSNLPTQEVECALGDTNPVVRAHAALRVGTSAAARSALRRVRIKKNKKVTMAPEAHPIISPEADYSFLALKMERLLLQGTSR